MRLLRHGQATWTFLGSFRLLARIPTMSPTVLVYKDRKVVNCFNPQDPAVRRLATYQHADSPATELSDELYLSPGGLYILVEWEAAADFDEGPTVTGRLLEPAEALEWCVLFNIPLPPELVKV